LARPDVHGECAEIEKPTPLDNARTLSYLSDVASIRAYTALVRVLTPLQAALAGHALAAAVREASVSQSFPEHAIALQAYLRCVAFRARRHGRSQLHDAL